MACPCELQYSLAATLAAALKFARGRIESLRLQLNIENLLDREYFVSAHSNNNITPGSPRAAYLEASFTF